MKKTVKLTLLTVLLLAATVVSSQAADMEDHSSGDKGVMPSEAMHEMMMERMATMKDKEMMVEKPCIMAGKPCTKPCMAEGPASAMHHGKTGGMSGMMAMEHGMTGMPPSMHQRMEHELFLDRVDALDLDADQVAKLKVIRSDCRKENIRKAADMKIARLELQDLLNETDWSLNTAEPLIRQIQTLEGDMLVRHLQAVADARKVLTAEQLQRASAADENKELEELFQ